VGDLFGRTWVGAPGALLGDRSGAYGSTLTYDIFLRFADAGQSPAVALAGSSISLFYSLPAPPVNAWATLEVPLSEAGWKINHFIVGAQPTACEFRQVLGTLEGLYLLTEWNTGADDTNIDNVALGTAGGCSADEDGDGDADVFDLLTYLDMWFLLEECAERTGDRPVRVNVFDLLAYLDRWFAGC
jgi:hypothetical protein